jgi:hypothetical protein
VRSAQKSADRRVESILSPGLAVLGSDLPDDIASRTRSLSPGKTSYANSTVSSDTGWPQPDLTGNFILGKWS